MTRLRGVPQRIGGRPVPFSRTVLLVQLAVALVILGYVLINQRIGLPGQSAGFELRAAFSDAAGLDTAKRPPVMVAGVVAGYVKDVEYRDGQAIATLALDGKARGRVFRDASALITPRSAINDLTIDIDPGTPGTAQLPERGLIAPQDTSSPVGLDRLTSVLNADTQAYARVLLAEASTALGGRSQALDRALQELSSLMDPTTRVAAALADRRRRLARLVGALDDVFATLGDRGRQLGDVVRYGEATLAASARQSERLAASMRALPPTLASVQRGLDGVRALSEPLVPALRGLRPGARRMPAALTALRRFVPAGRGLLDDLDRLGRRGAGPARDLATLLRRLGSASRTLEGPVADLEPLARTLARYKSGLPTLGDRFSGVFSTNDANGSRLRAYGFFEPIDPTDLGFSADAAGRRRTAAAAVTALTRVCLKQNPVACLTRYVVPGLPGAVAGLRPSMRAPR